MRTIAAICAAIEGDAELTFRPWRVDDARALVAAWTDPAIARWNPVPEEPTLDLAERWIRSTETQNEASVGIDVVAVRSGEVAGEIGLQVDPAQAIGEVGFWVGSSYRGHGVGHCLLRFAEQLGTELELRGLVALVDPANASALALLESVGWPEIPTKSERRAFAYRVPGPTEAQ